MTTVTSRALAGQIAVVTGASRGVGKGIALGLGETGMTVYVTGRTTTEGARPGDMPGTIEETAAQVTAAGGRGIAVACDHAVDSDVEALIARVIAETSRIDVLVNNAFAIPNGKITAPSGSCHCLNGTPCIAWVCALTTSRASCARRTW